MRPPGRRTGRTARSIRVAPRLFVSTTASIISSDVRSGAMRAAVHAGRAAAEGWPEWINIPSKVAQVAAVRVAAAGALPDGALVAAVCPGLIDTDASRPWFDDMSAAQTPAQAATALLDLALAPAVDPRFRGELVQFGRVLPWEPVAA